MTTCPTQQGYSRQLPIDVLGLCQTSRRTPCCPAPLRFLRSWGCVRFALHPWLCAVVVGCSRRRRALRKPHAPFMHLLHKQQALVCCVFLLLLVGWWVGCMVGWCGVWCVCVCGVEWGGVGWWCGCGVGWWCGCGVGVVWCGACCGVCCCFFLCVLLVLFDSLVVACLGAAASTTISDTRGVFHQCWTRLQSCEEAQVTALWW